MTARHNTTHRPQGWQNGLCEDANVTASTQTSMQARTCHGARVQVHDVSRLRRAFSLGFHKHAFYVRERFVKRDVWVLVRGTARDMCLMWREHVDVDVERFPLALMLGTHGQADATAQQIAANTLQAVCTVNNRLFDRLGVGNTLERDIDWHAHD